MPLIFFRATNEDRVEWYTVFFLRIEIVVVVVVIVCERAHVYHKTKPYLIYAKYGFSNSNDKRTNAAEQKRRAK